MTREDTVTLATFSSMMHEADKHDMPRKNQNERRNKTSPMTRAVARLVKVSHITSGLLKYFPARQTMCTRLLNQYTRVADIIQSSDSRGSQSDFIHSCRTRDAYGVREGALRKKIYAYVYVFRKAPSRTWRVREGALRKIYT